MPYSLEQKNAAARNQETIGYAAATLGTVAAGSALIPVAGAFVTAGCGVLAGALSLRVIHQGKIARDPPRQDYSVDTKLGPVRLNISDLARTPSEIAVADLVSTTDELTRLIEANVLAVERSDGARAADHAFATRARAEEALRFAELIADRLDGSSIAARSLASALGDSPEGASNKVVEALERLGRADEEWADEIRRGLQSDRFFEESEGTASEHGLSG
jgi:hypothetical protein